MGNKPPKVSIVGMHNWRALIFALGYFYFKRQKWMNECMNSSCMQSFITTFYKYLYLYLMPELMQWVDKEKEWKKEKKEGVDRATHKGGWVGLAEGEERKYGFGCLRIVHETKSKKTGAKEDHFSEAIFGFWVLYTVPELNEGGGVVPKNDLHCSEGNGVRENTEERHMWSGGG